MLQLFDARFAATFGNLGVALMRWLTQSCGEVACRRKVLEAPLGAAVNVSLLAPVGRVEERINLLRVRAMELVKMQALIIVVAMAHAGVLLRCLRWRVTLMLHAFSGPLGLG